MRLAGCCLPPCPNRIAIPGSVSFAAQTLPAPSPVNASPPLLRAPPHDSGSLWLARPLTYDSFIHYNLPVYPGALGHYRADCSLDNHTLVPLDYVVCHVWGSGSLWADYQ